MCTWVLSDATVAFYLMSNDFYDGMLAYEQKCEEILDKSNISEEAKIFIQTQILDVAQRIIEEQHSVK